MRPLRSYWPTLPASRQQTEFMRDDLRPYWVKKTYLAFRRWYTDYFLRPECVHMGPYETVMKPW